MNERFDTWLEDEFKHTHAELSLTAPDAARWKAAAASPRGNSMLHKLAALPALLGTKALIGTAAVTMAAASGVAVKTAYTGTPNPLVWSQQVHQQAQDCHERVAGQQDVHGCVQNAVNSAQPRLGHGLGGDHPSAGSLPGVGASGSEGGIRSLPAVPGAPSLPQQPAAPDVPDVHAAHGVTGLPSFPADPHSATGIGNGLPASPIAGFGDVPGGH